MGYLTDIVRDSRRRSCAARAAGESAPVDPVEIPAAATVAPATAVAGPPAAVPSVASVERIREEGSGRPGEAELYAVESGCATRQVAGPSPAEHVPAAGLPEAISEGLHLSDPVARAQAGCESARTVTDGFRAEKAERFRGGDSNDAPAVPGVEDGSSILESSPGYAATSRAGKESVETQERRQAGMEPRAGSVTPPERPGGRETVAVHGGRETGEWPRSTVVPARGEQEAARRGPPSHPEVMPEGEERAAVSSGTGLLAAASRRVRLAEAVTDCTVTVPIGVAVVEPGSGRASEPGQADRQRIGEEKREPGSAPRPQEPRVRIGAIEVVVVSPAPVQPEPSRGERSRPDPASRNYLRNF